MEKEVADHTKNGNWKVVLRAEIPKGVPVLPAVWSMKHKRRIATREVYKWKARRLRAGSIGHIGTRRLVELTLFFWCQRSESGIEEDYIRSTNSKQTIQFHWT
jgi:hypothetical protein